MIYHITLYSVMAATTINKWMFTSEEQKDPEIAELIGKTISGEEKMAQLAEFIKSSKDDTFIFIPINLIYNQWKTFPEWIKRHSLEDYVKVHTRGICNPVHPGNGHNLQVVIMQSKEHSTPLEKVSQ